MNIFVMHVILFIATQLVASILGFGLMSTAIYLQYFKVPPHKHDDVIGLYIIALGAFLFMAISTGVTMDHLVKTLGR